MTTRALPILSNTTNISTIAMNKNVVVLTHIINITISTEYHFYYSNSLTLTTSLLLP